MTDKTYIIGSRGSDLALWQAHFFQDRMKEIGVKTEIKIIKTQGDRIQHLSFDKMEGKGFFTKEIEQALHDKSIDIAIHSHKDLETSPVPGLVIAGVSDREDPSELLLIRKSEVDYSQTFNLKKGAILGTSSARRKGQITDFRPDVEIKDIRGNVPTRINKLREGQFDAILIAFAGVHRLRLDLSDLHVEKLNPQQFIPAPAQGVLAYQCREDDQELIQIIGRLSDSETKARIDLERGILSTFGGGCQIPLGAYAEKTDAGYRVRVAYSRDWNDFSHRLLFDCKDIQSGITHFKESKSSFNLKSLLITKTLESDSFLKRATQAHNIELSEEPFIQIEEQDFPTPNWDNIDWVFFTSKNAVSSVLKRVQIPANKKIGVIGEGTNQALKRVGIRADFHSEQGNTEDVAKEFASVVGNEIVWFPQSDISNQTIQKHLAEKQCINQVTYKTLPIRKKLDYKVDAIVFTSPSNVKAYFDSGNEIEQDLKVVAIGEKTASTLATFGCEAKVATHPTEAEIYSLLC